MLREGWGPGRGKGWVGVGGSADADVDHGSGFKARSKGRENEFGMRVRGQGEGAERVGCAFGINDVALRAQELKGLVLVVVDEDNKAVFVGLHAVGEVGGGKVGGGLADKAGEGLGLDDLIVPGGAAREQEGSEENGAASGA